MSRIRILGIPGSLRHDSHNRQLLVSTSRALPPGARLVIWDRLEAIPPFNEDREHPTPPAVDRLRRAIAEAHGVLIATPEYNGSIPGQLKNALDWASRPRPAIGPPPRSPGRMTRRTDSQAVDPG